MSEKSSAAHWCKTVMEEVSPTLATVPPPVFNYKVPPQTVTQPQPTTVTPALSQYERYYAQYYNSTSAATTTVSQTATLVTQDPYSTAALTASTSMTTSAPIYPYSYPYPTQSIAPVTTTQGAVTYALPATYAQITQKKPNQTRFQAATTNSNPQVTSEKTQTTNKTGWSPSLKSYVEKCFSECVTDADRGHVTDLLQVKIQKVAADGRLAVHRWDLEQVHITST